MRHRSARQRKLIAAFAILWACIGLVAIVWGSVGFVGAVFFIIIGSMYVVGLRRLSAKSIMKSIEVEFSKLPKSSVYSFFEDNFVAETEFETSHVKSEHSYSAVAKVNRVDDKTLYILLKNNTYCAIESDLCDEIADFISTKVSDECFKPDEPKLNLLALLLCIIGGIFGVHQFYFKNVKFGILYVFTFGLFYVGVIIDAVRIVTGKKPLGCK